MTENRSFSTYIIGAALGSITGWMLGGLLLKFFPTSIPFGTMQSPVYYGDKVQQIQSYRYIYIPYHLLLICAGIYIGVIEKTFRKIAIGTLIVLFGTLMVSVLNQVYMYHVTSGDIIPYLLGYLVGIPASTSNLNEYVYPFGGWNFLASIFIAISIGVSERSLRVTIYGSVFALVGCVIGWNFVGGALQAISDFVLRIVVEIWRSQDINNLLLPLRYALRSLPPLVGGASIGVGIYIAMQIDAMMKNGSVRSGS